MIIGTNHFPSLGHAARYYRPYGYEFSHVEQMLADGTIEVGLPSIKPGDELQLIDGGLRWAILEANS